MLIRNTTLFVICTVILACEKSQTPLTEAVQTAPKKQALQHNQDPLMETEPVVRVLILEGVDQFLAEPNMQYSIKHNEQEMQVIPGQQLQVTPTNMGVQVSIAGEVVALGGELQIMPYEAGSLLTIRDVAFGQGWWWANEEDRTYTGPITVRLHENGKLNAIVEVAVEEYLRGVVPSEIGPTAPMEALKAQAVAARSETITALRKGIYNGPGYDICSTVQCQVYAGTSKGNPTTDQAIRETRGLVLAYNGETIPAYYSSNCGGHTENIENVWKTRFVGTPVWQGKAEGPEPITLNLQDESELAEWIESRPAVYCNRDTYPQLPAWAGRNFRWTRETTAQELGELIRNMQKGGADIGYVKEIIPIKRGVSGRIDVMKFVGEKGELEVGPELNIRRIWDAPLKSSAIVVEITGTGKDALITVNGAGYGHGVGMCQTGAMGRAHEGQLFDEILQHYYSESEILTAYK